MLEVTIASSALIVVIILLRCLFKGKIDLRLQYALWLLVAARLLMPFPILQSSVSVLNVLASGKPAQHIGNPVSLAQPDAFEATNLIIPEDLTDITGNEELAYDTIQDKTASLDLAMRSNTRNGVLHTFWRIGVVITGSWFVVQNIWFWTMLRKRGKKQ